jgi:hypothetical protein
VTPPRFTYTTQQGWVDPANDLFQGASLEWFIIQKWMAALDSHLAVGIVPVDASLASFGDINREEWPGEFAPKTSTMFSYVMNNYWDTNYRAGQGGAFTFRYVLTPPAGDCRPATRNQHNFSTHPLRSANLCDGVEDDLGKLDVSQTHIQLKFQPHEVLTVRLVKGIE